MKRKIGVAVVLGLLALGAIAPNVSAQCGTGPMIDWDANSFAYETNYNSATLMSAPGSSLTVVGIVNLFCSPLAFLDPNDPTKEYTFVFSGLTSGGTVMSSPFPGLTVWATDYTGGTFAIYEGAPRNAPVAGAMPINPPNASVPALFQDGTVILSGTLANFHTEITQQGTNAPVGSFTSDYTFTGGTLGGLFAGTGTGYLSGLWCVSGCQIQAGYSAHPDGKFDMPPTPAQASTWGTIKTLYR
jgi:FtsP/CotA-like multicopper oxidase with cupredoxin domain